MCLLCTLSNKKNSQTERENCVLHHVFRFWNEINSFFLNHAIELCFSLNIKKNYFPHISFGIIAFLTFLLEILNGKTLALYYKSINTSKTAKTLTWTHFCISDGRSWHWIWIINLIVDTCVHAWPLSLCSNDNFKNVCACQKYRHTE